MLLFVFQVAVVLLAISAHECAHASAAWYYGDPTALIAGRMTLWPFAHLSWFGGFVMPLALFLLAGIPVGWAKQLPVNDEILTRKQYAAVCAAGPAANAFIALVCVALYMATSSELSMFAIKVNCALAVFNLLPVPGLDGYQIIRALSAKE